MRFTTVAVYGARAYELATGNLTFSVVSDSRYRQLRDLECSIGRRFYADPRHTSGWSHLMLVPDRSDACRRRRRRSRTSGYEPVGR